MTEAEQDADRAAQAAETSRVDALFAAIFEDDKRGAEVFELLTKRYGRGKVHTDGGIDAVLRTYREASHMEILNYIVVRCNRARGVPDELPAET